MKEKLFGPRLSTLYRTIGFYLITFTLFRLFLLGYYRSDIAEASTSAVFKALYLGLKFDFRLTAFLLIPIFLVLLVKKMRTKWNNILTYLNVFFMFILTSVYITDAAYYGYLKSRVNSTILQFFKNPIISMQMVQESYPWPLFIVITLTISALTYVIFKKIILTKIHEEPSSFKKSIPGLFIFTAIWGWSIYGNFSAYPLRWSEAFNSPNNFTSNLGLNPVLYLFDTYSFRNADYNEQEVRKNYHLVANFLGVKDLDEKNLNFVRSFPENPERRKQRPNVVIVIMESLALYKTGIGGSQVNPTPYLDQLAKESMFFKNFYTPTVATARSVFAAITSLPDVSKVKTGSRNPFIVNQHTNIAELVDHDKYYFLGGSANWGNIRGVLSHNIPDLKIYEEGSYSSPRVDVWGISDLDLFKEAHNVLKEISNEKPFFAIIQSAGFHRPYTIPENSDQFKTLSESEVDMNKIKEYGFESLAEYNAMRLQDYSLGRFIEMAKKEKYYKNTIFMVFGDHGLPHNNAPNVPDWSRGQAHGYHVPFIIHSPKYIQPSVEERIASEMDVMPSVAGIVGVPFKTRSLGRDLFNTENDTYRAAFSYNWYAPFHISLIDKDYYFEMIPSNDEGTLKKWNAENPNQEMKEIDKEKYQEMKRLTKGLYETSKYLLHHNPKIK